MATVSDEVSRLKGLGYSNKAIAESLGKTPSAISYYTSPDYKARNRQNQRQRRNHHKAQAVASKGGKCQICGYSKCVAAMDFHHTDPTQKDPMIREGSLTHLSAESLEKQLRECVLLCCRCHREVHAGMAKVEACAGIEPAPIRFANDCLTIRPTG